MLNVQGVSGEHNVLGMVSHSDAQLMPQGLPDADLVHNTHPFASQLEQGQVAAQMIGPEVQQGISQVQGVTVNHFNPNLNISVYTNTVSTPCISFPATQVNNSTLEGHMGQDSSSTRAGGVKQVFRQALTQESTDTVILSLQALRNSADMHGKVNARYQELEDSNQIEQGSLELLL